MDTPLKVKVAGEAWEFDQIHALNYRTFVEEIPRYRPKEPGRLVDRFHDENTYVIGLRGERLVGMVAVRDRRPFALDERVSDLDAFLPAERSTCELRLLAVEPAERRSDLLPALLDGTWHYCRSRGFDMAVISGLTGQLRLYRHLGFLPFGPLVGPPGAQFQPMLLTLERFLSLHGRLNSLNLFANETLGDV